MKFNRTLVVFTILICMFFSISCVVAGDVNDTSVTTYENQIDNDVNDELIASPQDDPVSSSEDDLVANAQEDVISDSDKGTFTELQKIINNASAGSTIDLEKDYTYDYAFNNTLGIVIDKNLTINGNGHTLNGLSKSRILFIKFSLGNSYNKVILNNIVFKNGYTKLYGGAIFNFADLTVNKCSFSNNFANTTAGAICSIGSLNCKNSNFNKNKANGSAGAIFSLHVDKLIPFLKNYISNANGVGDIDVSSIITSLVMEYLGNHLTDNISNCKFTNNVALGRGGGAVYAFSHINILSSTFTSNKAKEVGGAVYGAKDLYIKNSKFTKNKVSVYGGAVYFKFHEISGHYDENGDWKSDVKFYSNQIEKCVFTENVAGDRGGAIYGFKFSKMPKLVAAHAVKCTFSDNKASDSGNEIYGGSLKNCVLKNTLTLKAVKVKKSAKKLVLTATLKKGSKIYKNKKITFKFKGKKYTAKTNKKGVAKVTIKSSVLKKLKVGKTVKYQATYKKFIARKSAKVYK